MSRALDQALASQRQAADPEASVWVAANAGAGKTRVLVDRVLRLLVAGTRPEAILCLTFTKAAAAEMANRLYGELGTWAIEAETVLERRLERLTGRRPDSSQCAEARRLFARLLDAPGGLRIQTIHAFCQSLLARFPLEAGLAPQFQVLDERAAAELLATAQDRILIEASARPETPLGAALRYMVAQVDESTFAALLHELVGARGRLGRLLRHHGGKVERAIAATRAALGLDKDEDEESLLRSALADEALEAANLARAAKALAGGSDADRKKAGVLTAFLGLPVSARLAFFTAEYRSLFLTAKAEAKQPRSLTSEKARQQDNALLDLLLAEQARILELDRRLKAARVGTATAALWRLGAALIEAYERAKARAARLDYDDLILRTRDLLNPETAPWVLYKLDGGIDHILVDEAQDTAPEQWQVIAALAEEFFAGEGARARRRTLFAVGDEKQSIYGFQGADPGEFARMRDHFAARVGAAGERFGTVALDLSFRSTGAVLEAVDAVFALPHASGVSLSGGPVRHEAHRAGEGGLVEIWEPVTPEERPETSPWDAPLDQVAPDSPRARLAERIAETIAGWLGTGEELASRGRAIRPGDIMILVRQRDSFVEAMVRALKQRAVPVAGADRMVLTQQIAVMDLLALARFALLPEDDLSLAELLKSPLVGLSEEDLFHLAHGREGRLWAALEARRAESPAFAQAHLFLSRTLAQADFAPPYEFFAQILEARGGRRRLYGRLGPEAADPIDEFLGLALAFEREHPPSLQGFLYWIEMGGDKIKRDMEQARDEVRIMTVHAAKGLEAEIVFLPDTCRVPDGRTGTRLLWTAEEAENRKAPPLLLWPVRRENDEALCQAARERARVVREAEYRRLLYVAMTRARDRLYICGHENKRGRSAGCWYDLVAAGLDGKMQIKESAFGPVLRLETAQIVAAPPAEPKARIIPQTETALTFAPAPAEPAPPRPLTPSRPDEAEPPALSPLGPDRGRRFHRGRLIHRLLQSLPDLAPEARADAAARFLARKAHGLDEDEQREIAAETLAIFAPAELAPLFAPGSRAEVPLVGRIGARILSGRIDRLAVTAEKVLIADYKSNRPPPSEPAAVAPIYLRQMAAYRAALREIYPRHAIEALLIWTDGPRLMPLPPELLDRWDDLPVD